MNPTAPEFPLGRVVATSNALSNLAPEDIHSALLRHASGDWGDVDEHDRKENQFAVKRYLRLFSVYHSAAGVKFYVITEADRSLTNVEFHISRFMLSLQKC